MPSEEQGTGTIEAPLLRFPPGSSGSRSPLFLPRAPWAITYSFFHLVRLELVLDRKITSWARERTF